MANEPIVETTHGKVRGVTQNGVFIFKAIPYGASTAGAGRFMPPKPPQAWAGVRDCLEWGANAPQRTSGALVPSGLGAQFREFFGMTPDVPTAQSEDCLLINVFTPALRDGKKRPVMFWIHGGGFAIGTGSGARTNGANLAQRQDVVSVSINHRIGAFGYCDLSAFSDDFARSGTVGQQDIILALQWVRDNIEAFGGDPARVTIHGESGGGAKVSTLLAMPNGNGLFASAICQSGVAAQLPSRENAEQTAAKLLAELQLDKSQLRKLQDTPADALLEAAAKVSGMSMGMGAGFAPSVGGADLPIPVLQAVAAGSAHIPLLVGCTKHEATLFMAGGGNDPANMTDAHLQHMAAMFGPSGAQVIAGYRANHPDYAPGDIAVRAMTDTMMRLPSIQLAEAHIKGGGAPTFMYLFTWESPVLPHLHAAHGIDTPFYFDTTETVNIAKGNPEAQALAARASAAWASFARTGDPSTTGLPAWPRYSLDKRETMILAATPHIEHDPLGADREMRQKLSA